jgi:hypothetical protein
MNAANPRTPIAWAGEKRLEQGARQQWLLTQNKMAVELGAIPFCIPARTCFAEAPAI